MAAGPEAKVKAKIRRWLIKQFPGCWTYMAPGGRFGRKGVPDILACIMGLFVAIEVKATEGMDATDIQKYELKLISKAGGIECVIAGYNELQLQYIKNEVLARVHPNLKENFQIQE